MLSNLILDDFPDDSENDQDDEERESLEYETDMESNVNGNDLDGIAEENDEKESDFDDAEDDGSSDDVLIDDGSVTYENKVKPNPAVETDDASEDESVPQKGNSSIL